MPKGVPLTEEATSRRRREILDAAEQLFVNKGFQNTSMREIGEAAGVGKSTLYDYFQTKEQILAFALEEAMLDMNERAQAIAGLALPPDERIRQIMKAHLALLQANRNLLLRLTDQSHFLSTEELTRIGQKRYAYQDIIRGLIEAGTAQGRFRAVNALVAARMLTSSLLSVFHTTRPAGTVEEMLDEVVGIFLRGISV